MKDIPYHKRNNELILKFFKSKGIGFIHGTSQDYAKHAALILYNKLAITIPNYLGEYIGIKGEHSNLQLFRKLGYDRKKGDILNLEEYKKKLNLYFDSLRKIRKFELLIMQQQFELETLELLTMQQRSELEKLELKLEEPKLKITKKTFTRSLNFLKLKLSKLKISFRKYK